MTTVLNDLLRQLDNPQNDDPDEQVLAAACVIRHGKSMTDITMLHEMLGLAPPPAGRCPDCAGFTAAPGHDKECAVFAARRILAIAGSIR